MKSFIVSLFLALPILFSLNRSFAQKPISLIYMTRLVSHMDTSFEKQYNTGEYSHGKLRLNELNSRIIRHFIRNYGEAETADWSLTDDGNKVAALIINGVMTWVSYARNGDFLHTHKLYNEEHLDGAVRHRIKSVYYDWRIERVIETDVNESHYYLVSISNKKPSGRYNYLVLHLTGEDEMKIVQEYSELQRTTGIANR